MYNVIFKISDGIDIRVADEVTYQEAYSLVMSLSEGELVSESSTNMGTVLRFEGQLSYFIIEKLASRDVRIDQYT